MKSCALALLDLANDKSLAAGLRAPVISVLRLLATRNAVDPALIPSDLDPK
jgi:hypothetical protein